MKKGYWVVAYRAVHDVSGVQAYSKLAGPAIQAHGGKFLVRTADQVEAFEAGLKQRTVIVEFESYQKALSAHQSDDYHKALEALGKAADRDFRIVEGSD